MGKNTARLVNEAGLAKYIAECDLSLESLKNRFAQLEALRENNELTTTYIAFEGLSALLGGRMERYSDDALRDCWPAAWGNSTVAVPAALLKALAESWVKYKESDLGTTLGEAFNLEGHGQGKSRVKDKQVTRDQNRKYARDVVALRAQEVMPLEPAYEKIADRQEVSIETVRAAYKNTVRQLNRASRLRDY
jgi:hypothetical protein